MPGTHRKSTYITPVRGAYLYEIGQVSTISFVDSRTQIAVCIELVICAI